MGFRLILTVLLACIPGCGYFGVDFEPEDGAQIPVGQGGASPDPGGSSSDPDNGGFGFGGAGSGGDGSGGSSSGGSSSGGAVATGGQSSGGTSSGGTSMGTGGSGTGGSGAWPCTHCSAHVAGAVVTQDFDGANPTTHPQATLNDTDFLFGGTSLQLENPTGIMVFSENLSGGDNDALYARVWFKMPADPGGFRVSLLEFENPSGTIFEARAGKVSTASSPVVSFITTGQSDVNSTFMPFSFGDWVCVAIGYDPLADETYLSAAGSSQTIDGAPFVGEAPDLFEYGATKLLQSSDGSDKIILLDEFVLSTAPLTCP